VGIYQGEKMLQALRGAMEEIGCRVVLPQIVAPAG